MKTKILGLLAVGLLAGSMAADAAVMDFDGLSNGGTTCNGGTCNVSIGANPYVEDGFQVQARRLASWDTGNTHFTGSKALFDDAAETVTLTRVGGGTFSLFSIDLADVYNNGFPSSLIFTGTLLDSTTITSTWISDSVAGYQRFAFSDWSNLVSVTWRGLAQFDNICIDSRCSSVPEPGSLALLGLGLAGLGLSRRRKAN